MNRKKLMRGLVLILLPLLLWWAWRDISIADLVRLMQTLKFWQVGALIGLNTALIFLMSLRWWLILRLQGFIVQYHSLAGYRLAGFAVSFLTPGPQFGGEPVQVFLLANRSRVPGSVALASVILDKAIELMANFTFLAVGILVVLADGLLVGHRLTQLALPMLALVGLPAGYLAALWMGKRPFTFFLGWVVSLRWMAQRSSRWVDTICMAEEQAADFCRSHPVMFALILAQSLVVWGVMVFEYWLSFSFLGLTLSIPQVLFTLVAARIALLLPMPGGLGTLEASQVLAIRALQLDPVYAVGVLLLARARDLLLAGIGMGMVMMWTRNKPVTNLPVPAGEENQIISGG